MTDLAPEERAAIGARHVSASSPYWSGGRCADCMEFDGEDADYVRWPCDAARLLAALTAAETERDRRVTQAEEGRQRQNAVAALALASAECSGHKYGRCGCTCHQPLTDTVGDPVDDDDAEAERRFLIPINPDPATTMAKSLRAEKKARL